MKNVFLYGLILTLFFSCSKEDNTNEFSELRTQAKKMFGTLPEVALNPDNVLTDEKVALGKKLYFDVRLSKDNTQSCNTCHNLNTFGVDNKSFSIGNDGDPGGRNSPTTLNAALHIAQFWDGREPDVEAQAGGPILNPVEMAMPSEEAVVEKLSAVQEYQDMFASVYPNETPAITYNNLKKAIGAFERKLITPSKFDDYLAGNEGALTDTEKQGLKTFIEVGCASCHSGNTLGGLSYRKFGVYGDYWTHTKNENADKGRYEVTMDENDKYVFKVPSLRNIEKTYPYFHDGSVADLKEAVSIMAQAQSNVNLSDVEVDNITAFLGTLTGEVPQELKQ